MADLGHVQTDRLLESLEERLGDIYTQAYEDVKKKADDYFARFAVKDKAKRDLVAAGKMSKDEYSTWRRNQMLSGKRWTDLRDQLAQDLTNVNKIATGMVRGELNEVFAINANYSEYLIENGMRMSYGFTLYDRNTVANLVMNDPDIIPWKPDVDVPADLRWNRQMVTSHITQGILQGESIPHLSKRLLKTVNNDKIAAVRTARTAVTSAQNAGRQAVYDKAKSIGLNLQKEWLATLDGRTRHDHGAADGQRVGLDEKFDVGGHKMKYPGDMSAPGWLVYNCRCTTITVEPPHITKGEEPRKTYSEWVKDKKKEQDKKKKEGSTKKPQPKIVPFSQVGIGNANSVKEVEDIINNAGVFRPGSVCKLDGCDLDSAKSIASAYQQIFEKYPQLKGKFGAVTAKNLGSGTYAQCWLRSDGRVDVNNASGFYSNWSSVVKQYERDVQSNWHPFGTTAESVVTHEVGHAIDGYLANSGILGGRNAAGEYRYASSLLRSKIMKQCGLTVKDSASAVSRYGSTNPQEWFAEAFAEYITSANPRPVAATLGKEIERLLKGVK